MIKPETQGAVEVFTIEGPLNQEESERLLEVVEATPRVGRPQWVLDLNEVTLIDSAGCEALLDLRDEAAKVGGAVHLSGLSPLCHDILTATGVIRFFQTFDGAKQAIAQFAR